MKTIIALVAAAVLLGCAAQPAKKMFPVERINDGGRYSQMAWNNVVLMQIDWATPELCGAALKGAKSEEEMEGMSLRCSLTSAAADLPFAAVAENDIMGTKSPAHFRSIDFCRAVGDAKLEGARIKCSGPK